MRKEEIYLDKLWIFFNTAVNFSKGEFLLSVNEQEEACKILQEFSQESNKELLSELEGLKSTLQTSGSNTTYWKNKYAESQQMNERLVDEQYKFKLNGLISYIDILDGMSLSETSRMEKIRERAHEIRKEILSINTNQSQEKGEEG